MSSDAKFNRQQIAKFSSKDAENFEKYEEWLNRIVSILEGLHFCSRDFMKNNKVSFSLIGFLDKAPPSLKIFKEKENLISKWRYLKSHFDSYEQAKALALNYENIYRLMTEPAVNLLDEW